MLSRVRLFATPRTVACQASLSFTISWSLLKPMSIESVMPSNHLILCHPLLLLPSVFLSILVFSKESALLIRWSKYWSFSFSINPSNEYSGLTSLNPSSIPGSGRSPGEGNGNPLQYSCLENPMDRGAWWTKWTRFVIAFLPRSKCLLIS